ncbi:NUDIX hydrolase domain-like protein [Halteromyces radiatus]|uniref:NUDIX hydrolase domain-like protein n=1 Tax=Halteromyces radiatus TaxID=101107 RepID=UPI002220C4B5|nr:NUDIX hydrolase domain-like protein [Halteromyces radiatus]KAI8080064.1 NUDIX hydrolase domain-like protein [Halteromyces radiatus]
MTNIFEAAASGDLDYIKNQPQATLKSRNDRGWTVLHFAARYGQLDIATYLRDNHGELLTVVNGDGKTPAQLAQFWGYDQVAQLLSPPQQEQQQSKEQLSSLSKQVNHVNFFAGSPLNRYGWYRTEQDHLNRLMHATNARFLLFSKLDPLFDKNDKKTGLYWADVEKIKAASLEGALVFLGIDERFVSDKEGDAKEGIPYWALDITVNEKDNNMTLVQLHQDLEKEGLEFSSPLPLGFQLDRESAAILAQARAMVDWHTRNKFCPACGNPVKIKEAGYKMTCSSNETSQCISHNGIHNFAYPRTDAVVIVCIVHPTADKILLGRQKRWPARMFSCIAGFVEPGESIEEAVRREALEETGIHVDHVAYHSTQPWPFPNSLMFGFIASATNEQVKMEDKELESARWFSRSDVLGALKGDGIFTLPPKLAIAHQLILTWATSTQPAKM